MYDLLEEIQQKTKQLEASVKQLRKNGNEASEAQAQYYITKAKAAVNLKEGGMPVAMVQLVVKGQADVAKARLKWDNAAILYDANKEAVNMLKLELKLLDAQIQREWGIAGRE